MPRKKLYKPQSNKTNNPILKEVEGNNPLDRPGPRQKVSFSLGELQLLDQLKQKTGYRTRSRFIHDVALGYKPPSNDMTRQTDSILLKLNSLLNDVSGIGNNINQIAKRTNTKGYLHQQDAMELASAISIMPEIKKEIVQAAHLIVAMTCPTFEDDVSDS